VVAKIPLKDIYLMATPLHSQNFVDVADGVLTNNRRLVTKNMWFNGTELSAQARRALENEQVTIVTHETGCIHAVYPEASIDESAYSHFSRRLAEYLKTEIDEDILGNFVRHTREIQMCFQMRWPLHGVERYIGMERIFAYEEGTPYTIASDTRAKLMAEIDSEEFEPAPLPGRIIFNELEAIAKGRKLCMNRAEDVALLMGQFGSDCINARTAIDRLRRFCCVDPRLPDAKSKVFRPYGKSLGIDAGMGRDQIIECLESARNGNSMAEMAFYAYRDMNRTESGPFIVAAIQRNPVSIEGAKSMDDDEVARKISGMPTESIYDETGRLAQPDEVWNYGRGDGVEKALLLANILRSRKPEEKITVEVSPGKAVCRIGAKDYTFTSVKALKHQVWEIPLAG
jgi:hypothetical protein